MKNLKTRLAVLAISFVSFLGIQTANSASLEGLSVGLGYNSGAYMGTGKETSTSGAGTARGTDGKETGVFTDSVASAFHLAFRVNQSSNDHPLANRNLVVLN